MSPCLGSCALRTWRTPSLRVSTCCRHPRRLQRRHPISAMFGSSLPPPPLPCLPFCFFGLRTFFFFMPAWVRDVALSFGLVGFGRSFLASSVLRFSFFSASAAGASRRVSRQPARLGGAAECVHQTNRFRVGRSRATKCTLCPGTLTMMKRCSLARERCAGGRETPAASSRAVAG